MSKNLSRLVIVLSVFVSSGSFASDKSSDEQESYKPRIELTGKLGYSTKKSSRRNIARLGFVLPLYQHMDKYMSYLSVIGMKDSKNHLEGNYGLGHRLYINRSWLLGGYLYYDARKTENSNLIRQFTLGLEFLSKNIEIRGNIYLPFSKDHNLGSRNIYEINYIQKHHRTTIRNCKQNLTEIGLYGIDIEGGGNIPKYLDWEGYVALYHFSSKGVSSMRGIRFRCNYILRHWFSIEGEVNIDNKIGQTSYLGFKLSWDFISRKNVHKSLSMKMTQLPVRDIDAITATREESPFTVYENSAKGRVAAILPKKVLTDGSIIKANVPFDIGDVSKINKSQLLISNIAIISKGGSQVHVVGKDKNFSLATKDELAENNIKNINPSIIDKKTNEYFRREIAKVKVLQGMSHKDTVKFGLVTPEESIQEGHLTEEEAIENGIKSGLSKDELVKDNGLAEDKVKEVAKSDLITPKEAVKSKILTEDEAIEAGIRNGLSKDELVKDNGLAENKVKEVAKSDVITPRQAKESEILTEHEAVKKGIKSGLNRNELINDNGLDETIVKQVAQSGAITPRQAIEQNILTEQEAIESGVKNGLTKDQ
ncbi:MAG: inverse autotransporter beta domain-containing protein, partial [Legionellales bacterium]|nr:inverse autotransporter beta domain-containing protein [Legionellales bacterium]